MADPYFHQRNQIDILLETVEVWKILLLKRQTIDHMVLQRTKLGFIITGGLNLKANNRLISCTSIDTQLERFWVMVEQLEREENLSGEDKRCEELFSRDCKRSENGRLIVSLPKREIISLGNLKQGAEQRFYNMENKLNKNENMKKHYTQFMQEYENLNHMTEVNKDEMTDNGFYLPHHPVLKQDSMTTKLRVVFDGSFKSSNGLSINDNLLMGPNIQNELLDIIIRFRTYPYVLTADLGMMYR
ncbi:uncharacterized protein [Onthophagus taurus]|uniref:uncharacterized protein n=1 Tax=Onthophagus taurus TaxID=166361 RepID=UPI0039BDBC14